MLETRPQGCNNPGLQLVNALRRISLTNNKPHSNNERRTYSNNRETQTNLINLQTLNEPHLI